MGSSVGGAVQAVGTIVLTVFFWLLVGGNLAVAMEEESGPDDRGGGEGSYAATQSASQQSSQSPSRRVRTVSVRSSDWQNEPISATGTLPPLLSERRNENRYDEIYNDVKAFDPLVDQRLDRLIELSAELAGSKESQGMWKGFVWALQHWIVDRSWHGKVRQFLPMEQSPDNIPLISLAYVPALDEFLNNLVVIQKTFDERWQISGDSINATILRHLQKVIEEKIRDVVEKIAVSGDESSEQVVSSTAQVTSSLWSAVDKYWDVLSAEESDDWLEYTLALGKASKSMGRLVGFARTLGDLQLAMAVMARASGWLDREGQPDPLFLTALGGLSNLDLLEPPKRRSEDYQRLQRYVWHVLNRDIKGVMPADFWQKSAYSFKDIDFHRSPDDQWIAPTSQIIRANMFTKIKQEAGLLHEAMLNITEELLFKLLLLPAAESSEVFQMMPLSQGFTLENMELTKITSVLRKLTKNLKRLLRNENVEETSAPNLLPSPSRLGRKRKADNQEVISPVDAAGMEGESSGPILLPTLPETKR